MEKICIHWVNYPLMSNSLKIIKKLRYFFDRVLNRGCSKSGDLIQIKNLGVGGRYKYAVEGGNSKVTLLR